MTVLFRRGGSSMIRSFLQDELSTLREASILLISSQPGDATLRPLKKVAHMVDKLNYHATMEFSLRIVPVTISSVFPTQQDVDQLQQMRQLSGSTIAIGVGSGAAMDLAKSLRNQVDATYLVPSTSAGVMACSTSTNVSLILDPSEPTLIRTTLEHDENNATSTPVTVILEEPSIFQTDHAKLACRALQLDDHLRMNNPPLAEKLKSCSHADSSSQLLDLLQESGSLLHVDAGTLDQRRSPLLALASALIPTVFPSAPIFTFWASLLPGLQSMVEAPQSESSPLLDMPPTLASLALEPHPVSTLMDHVRANQALTKAYDVSDDVLEQILVTSLNR